MLEDMLWYSTVNDLVNIPESNFGVDYILERTKNIAIDEDEERIIEELTLELNTDNPLPVPMAYVTGITLAVDEVLHHKRPLIHIQSKVSAYSYASIMELSKQNYDQSMKTRIITPAKLQRLKTFRASNTRIYVVALITGNHKDIIDCYSLTFCHKSAEWIVVDFHIIGGPNGSH
jgi:hypothetical protein